MKRVGLREGARHFQDVVPERHLDGADIRSPQSTNTRKTRSCDRFSTMDLRP
jgi:hypothetical protein